jgi:hypothetical protein
MKQWFSSIYSKLEKVYDNRYDKNLALLILNDSFQEFLTVKTMVDENDEEFIQAFEKKFLDLRYTFAHDLFDRYPSDYAEVKFQMQNLRDFYESYTADVVPCTNTIEKYTLVKEK